MLLLLSWLALTYLFLFVGPRAITVAACDEDNGPEATALLYITVELLLPVPPVVIADGYSIWSVVTGIGIISVVIAAMVGALESASVLVTGSIDCWLVVVMTYIMTTFTSRKRPVSGYMWCFLWSGHVFLSPLCHQFFEDCNVPTSPILLT